MPCPETEYPSSSCDTNFCPFFSLDFLQIFSLRITSHFLFYYTLGKEPNQDPRHFLDKEQVRYYWTMLSVEEMRRILLSVDIDLGVGQTVDTVKMWELFVDPVSLPLSCKFTDI